MTQYSIDDQHGNNICGGLDERRALDVAQQYANDLGAPVLLYSDDGEEQTVEPQAAQEIDMPRSQAIEATEQLACADAAAGREPLWYRCGESYVSAESGHIGNTELGAAYVAAYAEARRDV